MDPNKQNSVWEAYFEAHFRYRYFLALKDRYAKYISNTGIAIAVLSFGPLANLFWETGIGDLMSGVLGLVAGLLGIYLGASGIAKRLATATRAATEWSRATESLRRLWTRAQAGEDVWAEYLSVDDALKDIDAAAIEHLQRNEKVEEQAWQQSVAALAPSN